MLRAVLGFAVHEGKIAGNPVSPSVWPIETVKRTRMTDDAALKAIWRALHAASVPRAEGHVLEPLTALSLRLPFLTSLRRGEVLSSKWVEFDLPNKLWTIPAARMKGARAQVVLLTPSAVAVIELIKESTAHRQSEYRFPKGMMQRKPWAA